MREFVMAFTTLPATFDAVPLARELVEAGVAACVNVLPAMQSVYRWEGATQVDAEQQLIIKTTRDRVADLWTALRARHPYQVPEFVVIPIAEGNPEYLDWIGEHTRRPALPPPR